MTFGTKLREARKAAGMTQEQLASVLAVSRQAVTKWEADKGLPDVENLKLIAKALEVSIDYLLAEEGTLDLSCTKEAINLEDYADRNASGIKRLLKKEKWCEEAVRARFPNAEIRLLLHTQIKTKVEKGMNFVIFLMTSFAGLPICNSVAALQSLQNIDKIFYLVTENEKQYLVLFTDEFMEIRRLSVMTENKGGKKFKVGNFQFVISKYCI